jgi:predicted RNA-binding protein Jag
VNMTDTIPESHATGEGANLSEAILDGARKLGLDPAEVRYKIDLSHFRTADGRNVGVDTVKILVWARDDKEVAATREARDWMSGLLDRMGFESKVICEASDSRLLLRVRTPAGGRLVGREGVTLDAVRTLMEAHLAARLPGWKFDIDVEDNRPRPSRDERDGPSDDARGGRRDDRGPRDRDDRGPRDRGDRGPRDRDSRGDRRAPRTEEAGSGRDRSGPRGDRPPERRGDGRGERRGDRRDERPGDRNRDEGEGQGDRRTDEEHLREMTRKMAERVIETGVAETTPPLNSYARRIVHLEITSFPTLQSESVGEGPHKKIRVAPLDEQELEIEGVDSDVDPEAPTGPQG